MKILDYQPIISTDIISDAELEQVEAGTCSAGCKKSCHDGQSNRKSVTIKGTVKDIGSVEIEI